MDQIKQYYNRSPEDESDSLPFSPASISFILQSHMTLHTVNFIKTRNEKLGGHFCLFLAEILSKIPQQSSWRDDSLVSALESLTNDTSLSYPFVSDINILFISIFHGLTPREVDSFIDIIVKMFWTSLTSVSGIHEVEVVKSLWQLQEKDKIDALNLCWRHYLSTSHLSLNNVVELRPHCGTIQAIDQMQK